MLPLVGCFRPWASWWKVVDWERRAPLVTPQRGRLQDDHLPTPAHAFPPTRAAVVAHEVAGATRPWGRNPQSPVPSCYRISRLSPRAVITHKLHAKRFPLHSPPCGFSDVWLRLVPLDFLFSVKALIKSLWITQPPSFIKLVGTQFLKPLFTCQVKLKLACGFKYVGCFVSLHCERMELKIC